MGAYDTRGGTPISPGDEGRDPSVLEDAVLQLLEEAGIDTEINDQIMKLVEAGERRKYERSLSAGTLR